jgi:hypothetical protein
MEHILCQGGDLDGCPTIGGGGITQAACQLGHRVQAVFDRRSELFRDQA